MGMISKSHQQNVWCNICPTGEGHFNPCREESLLDRYAVIGNKSQPILEGQLIGKDDILLSIDDSPAEENDTRAIK